MDFDLNVLKKELAQAYMTAELGLPDEVFKYITTITPMINVDLLLKDKNGRVLLAWRDDLTGCGWHIPGGIMRYKETFEERIQKTAEKELGCRVIFDENPKKISEIIQKSNRIRGHFISILYECSFPEEYDIDIVNNGKHETEEGFLKWHDYMPETIIEGQRFAYEKMLREHFEKHLTCVNDCEKSPR